MKDTEELSNGELLAAVGASIEVTFASAERPKVAGIETALKLGLISVDGGRRVTNKGMDTLKAICNTLAVHLTISDALERLPPSDEEDDGSKPTGVYVNQGGEESPFKSHENFKPHDPYEFEQTVNMQRIIENEIKERRLQDALDVAAERNFKDRLMKFNKCLITGCKFGVQGSDVVFIGDLYWENDRLLARGCPNLNPSPTATSLWTADIVISLQGSKHAVRAESRWTDFSEMEIVSVSDKCRELLEKWNPVWYERHGQYLMLDLKV